MLPNRILELIVWVMSDTETLMETEWLIHMIKVALGYTNIPEITYGFGLTAQWRSWDINAFFQGIAHCTFYIGGTAMRPFLYR